MRVNVPTLEHDILQMLRLLFESGTRQGVKIRSSEHSEGGEVIEVASSRPNTASIRMLVEDGVPGIGPIVGEHTRFYLRLAGEPQRGREEVPFFLSVLQAVVDGRLQEELWYRHGEVARSRSTVHTVSHGRVIVDDRTGGPLWSFPFGKPSVVIKYMPWGVNLDERVPDPG